MTRARTSLISGGLLCLGIFAAGAVEAAVFNFAGPRPSFTCPTTVPACNTATGGNDDINSVDLNGTNSLVFSSGGVTLTTAATTASGALVGTYYDIEGFDDGRGGLGVRASGFGGVTEQIDIGTGDVLTLTLNSIQAITGITVFGESHNLLSNTAININGTDFSVTNSLVNLAGLAASNVYVFRTAANTATDKDFYLSVLTVVPLPGAALLFGSALFGLAGWRRYRGEPAAA